MTNVIICLVIILAIVLIIWEICLVSSYGQYITDEKIIAAAIKHLENGQLNSLDKTIISTSKGFFTNVSFSLIVNYYWNGVGLVPRGSKLHKAIVNKYIELLSK